MMDQFVNDPANKVKVGTNTANFGECVGLVQKWFATVGAPFFYGNAVNLYANAPSNAYSKGTTWPAPRGAAAIFGAPYGYNASTKAYDGHTALSLGDGQLFEQNANPDGSVPHIHNYGATAPKGYIGYILPNNYQEGEAMIQDSDNEFWRWNKLFKAIRGRQASRAEFQAAAVGHTWLNAMEILSDNPEADAAEHAQEVGQVAVRDNWNQQITDLKNELAAGATVLKPGTYKVN